VGEPVAVAAGGDDVGVVAPTRDVRSGFRRQRNGAYSAPTPPSLHILFRQDILTVCL